jgi:hypothetical protein
MIIIPLLPLLLIITIIMMRSCSTINTIIVFTEGDLAGDAFLEAAEAQEEVAGGEPEGSLERVKTAAPRSERL